MTRSNIVIIVAALVVSVGSVFAVMEILELRARAADEACFTAPEPECLLDAAERIAATLEEDRQRAHALLEVARARGRIGDMAGMRRLLERATELAQADAVVSEPDISRPDRTSMAKVVTAWAEAGDRDRALDLANRPENSLMRAGRREALIGFLVRQGDIDGALAVAGSFEDNLVTARLLVDITLAGLEKGESPDLASVMARVGAIADGLADKAKKREARALTGLLQAMAGRTADALATADALGDEYSRNWIIQRAVIERAKGGDFEGALDIADRLTTPTEQVSALGSIIDSLISAGDRDQANRVLDQAERIAATITDPEERESEVSWIFDVRVAISDPGEAMAMIAPVEDDERRDGLYLAVAYRSLEAGYLGKAREATLMISSGADRRMLLMWIARAAAEAGDDGLAREVFKLTIADLLSTAEPEEHSSELGSIAEIQYRVGYFDDAWKTIALIDGDNDPTNDVLLLKALILARNGDRDAAQEVFDLLDEDDIGYSFTLGEKIVHTARAGNAPTALAFALRQDFAGKAFYLVQVASPDEIETSSPWRNSYLRFQPPLPTPEWPEGWDDCQAAPTDECVLTLFQEMAEHAYFQDSRVQYQMVIAAGWNELGQLEKARAAMAVAEQLLFQTVDDVSGRNDLFGDDSKVWRELLTGWVALGDWAHVEELANGPLKGMRWVVQTTLSEAYLEAGNLEAALAWRLRGDLSGFACNDLLSIGLAYLEVENEEAAENIVGLLKEAAVAAGRKDDRRSCLADRARLRVRMGLDTDFMAIAESLDPDYERRDFLNDIAESQVRSGDMESAKRTLEAIGNQKSLIYGYKNLAKIAEEIGDHEQAASLVAEVFALSRALPAGETRDILYYNNAYYLSERGDYDAALDFQNSIEDPTWRADSFKLTAARMAFVGERDKAAPVFRQAIEIAGEIPDDEERKSRLEQIALEQAAAGYIEDALNTAKSFEAVETMRKDIIRKAGRYGEMAWAMQAMRKMEIDDATDLLYRIIDPDPWY